MKKKVVVIGGGNGSAGILQALKPMTDNLEISAVVAMCDSGGSTGILRKKLNALPPGDILRAILSFSKYDYLTLKQIFNVNRFSNLGKLSNHNLGNLFLTLAEKYSGDFIFSIRALEQSLETIGHAYPATLEKTNLCVELENGEIIKGEAEIDRPDYPRKFKIKKAWLEPEAEIYKEAGEKIKEADYIILSYGSLYTSLIATILPNGIKEAILLSRAKLIYTLPNAFDDKAETGPEIMSDNLFTLENYLPKPIDVIFYHNQEMNEQQKKYYAEKKWVEFKKDLENLKDRDLRGGDLLVDSRGSMCNVKIGNMLKEILF